MAKNGRLTAKIPADCLRLSPGTSLDDHLADAMVSSHPGMSLRCSPMISPRGSIIVFIKSKRCERTSGSATH
jgi:hypothetical protein